MNTDILVVIGTDEGKGSEVEAALRDVQDLFAYVEAAASRFRPESELSRLNKSAGRPFKASHLLFTLVFEALIAAKATGGIFDPTILMPLITAGYDRSFELLEHDKVSPAFRPESFGAHSWRDVKLDAQTRTIVLPPGCGLDLGGIGKGWTVDRAAERLQLFNNYAVDAGGDIFTSGVQSDGSQWTVGVEDPLNRGSDLMIISVRDRAVATSTTARRRWSTQGRECHHLIDPRTGLPSESGVISATVVAESVASAEVLAKVALLLGPEAGLRFLEDQQDVEGLLVLTEGEMRWSRSFGDKVCGADY